MDQPTATAADPIAISGNHFYACNADGTGYSGISSYGYAIALWIRTSTKEGLTVREGALYPSLHRLEGKGFLTAEWGMTETNREAKFYRITPVGRKQLATELARWRDYSRIMTLALAASKSGD